MCRVKISRDIYTYSIIIRMQRLYPFFFFYQNTCRAILPYEGQDFLRRIVDNAVTMQRVCRIAYRFRYSLTYFPIELEEAFVKDTKRFRREHRLDSSEETTWWRLFDVVLFDESTNINIHPSSLYFLHQNFSF